MFKYILSLFLLSALIYYPVKGIKAEWFPSDKSVEYAKLNQVVLTCRGTGDSGSFLVGGQGEIYNVDNIGVWVITARHVSLNVDSCDAMFPDDSIHTAYLSKQFNKSDISILFIPKAYWPTHAYLASLKLNSNLFVFSEIKPKSTKDENGNLLGFIFDFDYHIHTGTASTYSPPELLNRLDWPVPTGSVAVTNLWSKPGSSGGGVYDSDGRLVGIVSCGSAINPNEAFIVDIDKAMVDEGL